MAVVLESTTEPQEEMNAAVGLPAGDQTNKSDQEEQHPGASDEQQAGSAAASGAATTENEEEEVEQGGKGGKKGGVQKRINTLTRRMREMEEELGVLRRTPAAAATEKKEAAPVKRAKPLPTDAKYSGPTAYEDYIEDLADWKAEQKFDELSTKRQQAELTQAEQERLQENFDAHLGRVEDARDRYDDFEEVTAARDVLIPAAVQAAIVESDISADLVYHLYKSPEDRQKLLEAGERSAASAVRLLGKIEAKLEASLAKDKKAAAEGKPNAAANQNGGAAQNTSTTTPKPKAASAAPAPITPVGGANTRTTIDRSKLSYQEYKRLRGNGTIR